MGIYIKGMEMPTRCWDCPLNIYGYCIASDSEHSDIILSDEPIPEWCPLVPVPPHGRLIDADALMKKGMLLSFSVQKWVQEVDITCAPTIIPTEEGE